MVEKQKQKSEFVLFMSCCTLTIDKVRTLLQQLTTSLQGATKRVYEKLWGVSNQIQTERKEN